MILEGAVPEIAAIQRELSPAESSNASLQRKSDSERTVGRVTV